MHETQQQIELAAPQGTKPRTGRLSRLVLAGPRWLRSRTREAGGVNEIQEGGRLIRDLATTLRRGPAASPRIYTSAGRHLDLVSTALSHGLSVAALEERMSLRRQQTTTMAYSAFAVGLLILGIWLWRAITTPWSAGRVVLGLEFIPFCVVFVLLAFKAAWQNWQLRTRRLGSAMEYLTTTGQFWPN